MSNWKLLLIVGVLFVIAGILALMNPFAASVAVERLAGIAFLVLGLAQVFEAFRSDDWGGRIWSMLMGLLGVIVGIQLLSNLFAGLFSLTLLLGFIFIISGVFKFVVGLRVHDGNLKILVVLSGVISAALGIMVLTNLPGSAIVTLGIMLGVQLISDGAAAIGLALSRKSGGVAKAG